MNEPGYYWTRNTPAHEWEPAKWNGEVWMFFSDKPSQIFFPLSDLPHSFEIGRQILLTPADGACASHKLTPDGQNVEIEPVVDMMAALKKALKVAKSGSHDSTPAK